jgi:hypothetical protein
MERSEQTTRRLLITAALPTSRGLRRSSISSADRQATSGGRRGVRAIVVALVSSAGVALISYFIFGRRWQP